MKRDIVVELTNNVKMYMKIFHPGFCIYSCGQIGHELHLMKIIYVMTNVYILK